MKRISIVFTETDDKRGAKEGQGFNVHLEGWDPERKDVREPDMSAAEFYGSRAWMLVQDMLIRCGVVSVIEIRK